MNLVVKEDNFSLDLAVKKKTSNKKAPKLAIGALCNMKLQKEVIPLQKKPSCKKSPAKCTSN